MPGDRHWGAVEVSPGSKPRRPSAGCGVATIPHAREALFGVPESWVRFGGCRVFEATLPRLALVGGWPGALVASSRLRHKTRKRRFRVVRALTIVAHVGGVLAALRA